MKTVQFRVLPEHLKLLRSAWVDWCDDEFGAPAIDPKRPYGDSDVLGNIAEALGIEPENGDFTAEQREHMIQLHRQTGTVLQIVLRTGEMRTGLYESEPYRENWKRVGD